MEIEKINNYMERMNQQVTHRFNDSKVDGSKTWVAFTAQYDAVNNKIEACYDSGYGSQVRVCYYGFIEANGHVKAKAAVETVRVNNAIMNITNMRRHGFKDATELAERDHIGEKKLYFYYREHAKEYADYDVSHALYLSTSDEWACRLRKGLSRAFDVGERRQNKVGVSNADAVAHAEHKQRVDEARNTIELLDDTGSKLIALVKKYGDVFKEPTPKIDNQSVRNYLNPYTLKSFSTMPCTAKIQLNKTKLDYNKSSNYMDSYSVFEVKYNLAYDEDTSIVTVTDLKYSCDYAFNRIGVNLRDKDTTCVDILLNDDIKYDDLFKDYVAGISVDMFDKPLSVAAARINKLAKLVETVKAAN